jgi:hypothetical protein
LLRSAEVVDRAVRHESSLRPPVRRLRADARTRIGDPFNYENRERGGQVWAEPSIKPFR